MAQRGGMPRQWGSTQRRVYPSADAYGRSARGFIWTKTSHSEGNGECEAVTEYVPAGRAADLGSSFVFDELPLLTRRSSTPETQLAQENRDLL